MVQHRRCDRVYTYGATGALPAGLTLDVATGVISGTPTAVGTSSFLVTATSAGAGACASSLGYNITVKSNINPATALDNALSNLVKVSPNPSNGDFNVDFSKVNLGKSVIRVYDAQGKTVFTSEVKNNLMTISLDKFADGIYLMEVETSKGRILKRLAKQ